ncbi:MAG: phage portal protein [Rhodocyclaceae bacterium]|nr:MAG: phage portal protein [Rhodocyclaceae bacterium]
MSEAAPSEEVVAKASIVEVGGPLAARDASASAGMGTDDEELNLCTAAGAISPPHPPSYYVTFWEKNTALRPVTNALETNVDGHGHRLVACMDLKSAETRRRVRISMALEALAERRPLAPPSQAADFLPSEAELDAKLERLQIEQDIEHVVITEWLSGLCPGISIGKVGDAFTDNRKAWRRDRSITGNGYAEVVRDGVGRPAELHHLKSATMRARPFLGGPVEVDIPVRSNLLRVSRVRTRVRFRTFVQIQQVGGKLVYFKQYGDPRVVSQRDGKVYPSLEHLKKKGHPPAHEIIWFKEPSPSGTSVYGVPPWLAADAVASGMRDAQVVNARHFDNNAVPIMAVLVNGAIAGAAIEKRVAEYFEGVKGIKNYGKVLVLSAAPAANTPGARVTIELKPLKQAVQNDALFQEYEKNCAEVIRSQYRIAKLILGMGENINRATAEAILQFLEDQVFGPMRREFDEFMNGLFMDLGFTHWLFQSNSPFAGNPKDAIDIAKIAADTGAPTYDELRELIGGVTNKTLGPINDKYAKIPIGYLKAMLAAGVVPDADPADTDGDAAAATPAGPVTPEQAEQIARDLAKNPRAAATKGLALEVEGEQVLAFLLPAKKFNRLLLGKG